MKEPMARSGLLPEIKRTLAGFSSDPEEAAQDSTRLSELDAVDRTWEDNDSAIDFVTASAHSRQFGAKKCLIIKPAIYDIPFDKWLGFTDFLGRECRRQEAVFQEDENTHFVVQFPDRPEETYSLASFFSSLEYLYHQEARRRAKANQAARAAELETISKMKGQ